jgi:hypothetical protein
MVRILHDRWFIITSLSVVLSFLGIEVLDFDNLFPIHKFLIFISTIFFIVFINLFRLYQQYERPFTLNPFHHIPTTAALARLLIAISLSVSFFSTSYSYIPAILYLVYFYFITSTYDLPVYHKNIYRGTRLIIDLVMAFIIFSSYGGIRNPGWMLFLVPITTMARHYSVKNSIITTSTSIAIIILISIFPFSSTIERVIIIDIIANIGPNFNGYVNNYDNLLNWNNFKLLSLINFVFILTTLIFLSETKNRMKAIFDFSGRFFEYINKHNNSVNEDLLNYLCVSLNVESIIVYKSMGKERGFLYYTFQNRNERDDYNRRCSFGTLRLSSKQEHSIQNWWGKTIKGAEIEQIKYSTDNSSLVELKTILFDDLSEIKKTRKTASLYPDFHIISIVPFIINQSHFLIINDLPTKFRIVPRTFWEDGMQKIKLAKYILEKRSL